MLQGSTHETQQAVPGFLRCTCLQPWAAYAMVCLSLGSPFVNALSISADNSSVTFSGVHAGREFSGEFEQFSGDVDLPNGTADEAAGIRVEFTTSSAVTGDSTYDRTLPKGDWFAVKRFPTALFESTEILVTDSGFLVTGNLTIKEHTHPVQFELQRQEERLISSLSINRLDYKIGYESDPEAEWVDKAIMLTIDIPAK